MIKNQWALSNTWFKSGKKKEEVQININDNLSILRFFPLLGRK